MPLAKEVAAELRKLADRLDTHAERYIPQIFVYMPSDSKESFLTIAKSLPRPAKKAVTGSSNPEISVNYDNNIMKAWTTIAQSLTCELIEPAKPAVYRCDPILSAEEDAELESVNG